MVSKGLKPVMLISTMRNVSVGQYKVSKVSLFQRLHGRNNSYGKI